MLKAILSTIIILAMIVAILYFIYKHNQCKITYEMETQTPHEKELELQCNQKKIFKTTL